MGSSAAAVSAGSEYDWVGEGNGMADEFCPPRGESVIKEGCGGQIVQLMEQSCGILQLKNIFFELLFSFFYSFSE